MSAISSFTSAANVYPAIDRNSFAHSLEAITGTKQAFAETDEEAPHEGREEEDEAGLPAMKSRNVTVSLPTNNHRYVLNVTA